MVTAMNKHHRSSEKAQKESEVSDLGISSANRTDPKKEPTIEQKTEEGAEQKPENLAASALQKQRELARSKGQFPRSASALARSKSNSQSKQHGPSAGAGPNAENKGWVTRPGMASSKLGTGRSRFDPQPLANVLGNMSSHLGWTRMLSVASIAAHWTRIVGPKNSQHLKVESFNESVLVVRATSTAWANQMRILLPTVQRRIDEELGSGIVKQVIIRGPANPKWVKKGGWRVPGRGPRDTYG